MASEHERTAQALANRFALLYPAEAARQLESAPPAEIVELLESQPVTQAIALTERLRPDVAVEVLERLPEVLFRQIVPAVDPGWVAAVLARMDDDLRDARLRLLTDELAAELRALMTYPSDSAGGLMDPRVSTFRANALVLDALARLRRLRHKQIPQLVVVDDDGVLIGAVPLQELAIAETRAPLESLMRKHPPAVQATASQTEVVEVLTQHQLPSVPVVDFHGRVVGIIRQQGLLAATEAEASADVQTMVGASKDERALSPAWFAVRKRLPWLQINLLTAFLAAFVVGLFESTIAQFTALAVLLPVVAGQSGNTGAQALAVTMRGLALREIRVRHWFRISGKELMVGAVNGVAVALVTGLAVYVWSRSPGLAGVIMTAMVSSMVIAGLAGASIPMILSVLGQDPAAASSIVLTTVTDVVGFLSFLGLATLAAGVL